MSKYHCHGNKLKGRALAVFKNSGQALWVCVIGSVSSNTRCVVCSACLSGRSYLATSERSVVDVFLHKPFAASARVLFTRTHTLETSVFDHGYLLTERERECVRACACVCVCVCVCVCERERERERERETERETNAAKLTGNARFLLLFPAIMHQ